MDRVVLDGLLVRGGATVGGDVSAGRRREEIRLGKRPGIVSTALARSPILHRSCVLLFLFHAPRSNHAESATVEGEQHQEGRWYGLALEAGHQILLYSAAEMQHKIFEWRSHGGRRASTRSSILFSFLSSEMELCSVRHIPEHAPPCSDSSGLRPSLATGVTVHGVGGGGDQHGGQRQHEILYVEHLAVRITSTRAEGRQHSGAVEAPAVRLLPIRTREAGPKGDDHSAALDTYSPGKLDGRSSRPAPRAAPVRNPPAPARPAPPPATTQSSGGGIMSGIGSTIAQGWFLFTFNCNEGQYNLTMQTLTFSRPNISGMAFGTGSAMAHRAVDAVMGPRTIQHETVVGEAAASMTPMDNAADDKCGNPSKAFQDCINHYGSDISKCQFYLDMLNECRRGGAGAGATL
ncbi:hypothetical protein TRIUR3_13982 [Triticum urartu]|uniref:Uncharacterized protein n=1 Tax=Triticum urartu TaxID=4572 RepID=M7YYU3_TRIUA|nr:hypothetical protein TRIUR3_13982 [Triticum urartu]